MVRHGRDEANLTFEAWNFKHLGGDTARCVKDSRTEPLTGDDFAPGMNQGR